MRQTATIGLLGGMLVSLVGCGGGAEDTTITLEATGSGERVEVSYEVDGDATSETVDLPWSRTVEVGGDWSAELVVENVEDRGTVTCSITEAAFPRPVSVDGEAAARCTASVSGGNADDETEATPFAAGAGDGEETLDTRPPASEESGGEESGEDDPAGPGEAVQLSAALEDDPERSVGVEGTIWAIDASEVVAIDTATGSVRRFETDALTVLDTLAVGTTRLAAIESGSQELHAGTTDGEQLMPVELPGKAVHVAVAQDLFWVTVDTDDPSGAPSLIVADADGRAQARFSLPGTAPAVIVETPTGAFAIDLERDQAYFADLATEEVVTVTLPEGAGVGYGAALESGDVVLNTTGGALLLVSPEEGGSREIESTGAADRVWSDTRGGAIVRYEDGTFALVDARGELGEAVELPEVDADQVAGVTDGALWFWQDDARSLVPVPLDAFG